MKLSDFADSLYKIISKEEIDLELPVQKASVKISLQRGKEIVLHNWEFKRKEKKQ